MTTRKPEVPREPHNIPIRFYSRDVAAQETARILELLQEIRTLLRESLADGVIFAPRKRPRKIRRPR